MPDNSFIITQPADFFQDAMLYLNMTLDDRQSERYSRHLPLEGFGREGQEKLLSSKVLLVGAGGLGSSCAYYLASAGVGTLGIVDSDSVDLSNLQRQILHNTDRIGTPKALSAQTTLAALNPDTQIIPIVRRLDKENILEIIVDYDIVIDGSDNFETRFLINDACVLLGKPLVTGAVLAYEGQAMTVIPRKTACYRCVFEAPPEEGVVPGGQSAGILGAIAGTIGSIMSAEAVKLLHGIGEPLKDRLLVIDLLTMKARTLHLSPNPDCRVCGEEPSIKSMTDIG